MIRMRLDQAIIAKSTYNAYCISQTKTMRKKNYAGDTGLSPFERFFWGELGQHGFRQYLWCLGVPFDRGTNIEGIPDTGDALIDGENWDVKNTRMEASQRMLTAKNQFERHSADYYVGVSTVLMPRRADVYLHGCLSRAEVEQRGRVVEPGNQDDIKVTIPTIVVEYSDLEPFPEHWRAIAARSLMGGTQLDTQHKIDSIQN